MGIILNDQGELPKPGVGHRYPSVEASIIARNFKGEAWTVCVKDVGVAGIVGYLAKES